MRTTLLLALLGCDPDGLYSADALANLYELTPVPDEPHIELRWHVEDQGIVIGCETLPLDEWYAELISGSVYALPPEAVTPPLWNERGDYRWAAAVAVLVNPYTYEPSEWEEHLEEEGTADMESVAGIWGGAEERAIFFAEGDLEQLAASDEQVILSDEVEGFTASLREGHLWVGVVPELVEQTGQLAGAMFPLSGDSADWLEDDGLHFLANERLTDAGHLMLSGEALGGAAVGCAQ